MLKRDFGILLLSVGALWLSLQREGPYQFKKAWYHEFDQAPQGEHELEEHPHVVPPPLVTDLNGDGKPEVLTATPDGLLRLLAPRKFGDGFAQAELLSQVQLDISGKMRIAALRSGYLTPPPKELVRAPRKQVVVVVTEDLKVVVVVTEDLKVICLNHNLQKEWEEDLAPRYPPHGGIREVAVHISDQRVSQGKGGGGEEEGDKGLVVVGASVVPLTLAQRQELENEVEQEVREEMLARFRAHGRKSGAANQERKGLGEETRHFSYFGFEGATGALRWVHESQDFLRDLGALQDQVVAQHSMHMRAEESEGRHYGEASCRDYRLSVLAALPHSWHSPYDTKLVPMRFEKTKAGTGAQKQQLGKMGALKAKKGAAAAGTDPAAAAQSAHAHSGAADVQGKSTPGAAAKAAADGKGGAVGKVVSAVVKAGSGPRAARRQQQLPPNVVVAHLEDGIEAIHLFSGRTVCRLHLPTPGLHVDLNGDGVPEYVVASGGDMEDVLEEGAANVGHERGRFCWMSVKAGIPARLPLFNGTVCRPGRARYLQRSEVLREIEMAPPIFLPQPGKKGQYRAGLGQKGMVVFLNSMGELSAYDSAGDLLWQHAAGTSWRSSEDEDVPPAVPTLRAMPLRPRAVPTVILAAGASAAVVMSQSGEEVDAWDLPDEPAMPLQLADFNFDGYTDVLLVSTDGIWAWAQVRHPGALPFSALVAALMVIMAAVFVTQQQGFAGGGDGGKRRPLRSTERED
ncbi:FG-GAP repeat-containing isoform B [Chlorella sorokiniana]|uniref:FG-GAP repeat-containing isoform B n=1 Tax=Chlorella sorokiniana TaxID=3076 RepID=A0A2P6U4D2_CHLSO|nr:FG-GAP repeat-containing isoform B [Chlorella sorokiniana]|eukprot:PRW61178.1 FG-GAP repeat-containing isoform B [Chlorella sorokiniana]